MTQEVQQQAQSHSRDERTAIRLAQANQRLLQEQKIFERRLERDKQIGLLQRCAGWVVLVMLPVVAVVCVVIFFHYKTLPVSVVGAASGAFFVDICGTVLAGYKSLMPAKLSGELNATTKDPFEDPATADSSGKPQTEHGT